MPLHVWVEDTINALRYRKVRPALGPCLRLADLGCRHDHYFLSQVRGLAQECWGLDLEVQDGRDGNITLMRRDITQRLPFADGYLDTITSLAVIEHVEDPRPMLRECFRCLKPGGRLVLTTPTRLGIYVHDLLIKTRLVRDVEPGEHKDFAMSRKVLARWVEEAGFSVETAETFECGMNLFLTAVRPVSTAG